MYVALEKVHTGKQQIATSLNTHSLINVESLLIILMHLLNVLKS